MNDNFLFSHITSKTISAFYKVYNKLGHGFLEKVYQKALLKELRAMGLHCYENYPIDVYYDDEKIGQYFADIVVEDLVILELKAAESLCPEHEAQLVNYLKSINLNVGLLLNFGKKPEIRRKVFSPDQTIPNHKNHNKS